MSLSSEQRDNLNLLLGLLRNGEISDDQFRNLRKLVASHDEARQLYLEYSFLVAQLRWTYGEVDEPMFDVPKVTVPSKLSSSRFSANGHGPLQNRPGRINLVRHSRLITAASLAIVGGLWTFFAYLIFFSRSEYSNALKSSQAVSVAVLTAERDCDWQASAHERLPYVGQQFKLGETLVLRSGIAELAFADGARIAIEGPSTLELLASGKAHLRSGKLAAHVPTQAVGFEIETPTARVVDLGTDFRLAVISKETKLAVATGKTDLYAFNTVGDGNKQVVGPARRLTAGQAVEITTTGSGTTTVQETKFDPSWLAEIAPGSSSDWLSSPVVAYQISDGAVGNQSNFHGGVGLDFEVRVPIQVYSLGVFDHLGDGIDPANSPIIQLWSRNNQGTPHDTNDDVGGQVLASQTFKAGDAGQLKLGHRFKPLPEPIELPIGSYSIVAYGLGGQNPFATFGRAGFASDPGWTGLNNTVMGNNYGWRKLADQRGGGVGGTFARTKAASFYGDTNLSRTLTLEKPITASGKFKIRNVTKGWAGGGDSGFFIGHFSTNPDSQELIGLEFKEDIGGRADLVRVRARLQTPGFGGSIDTGEWGFRPAAIAIDNEHTFNYSYDPDQGEHGRLTVCVDEMPPFILDLNKFNRPAGKKGFDAFGIGCTDKFNSEDDPAKTTEVYIDDVNYSGLRTIATTIAKGSSELARPRTETWRGSIEPTGSRASECEPGKFPQMSYSKSIGYTAASFEYSPRRERRTEKESGEQ